MGDPSAPDRQLLTSAIIPNSFSRCRLFLPVGIASSGGSSPSIRTRPKAITLLRSGRDRRVMDDALIVCRAIQFASAMLAFGGAAFRLYAVEGGDPDTVAGFDARLRQLLLIAALIALLSGLALVPINSGMIAGSASAVFNWTTMAAVLLQTSFGRVWRWHLLAAILLAIFCALRPIRPGYSAALA